VPQRPRVRQTFCPALLFTISAFGIQTSEITIIPAHWCFIGDFSNLFFEKVRWPLLVFCQTLASSRGVALKWQWTSCLLNSRSEPFSLFLLFSHSLFPQQIPFPKKTLIGLLFINSLVKNWAFFNFIFVVFTSDQNFRVDLIKFRVISIPYHQTLSQGFASKLNQVHIVKLIVQW